jgi:hypothetical protein
MKSRNPNFGHLRLAQQISHAFGVELDKEVVRRVTFASTRITPDGKWGRHKFIIKRSARAKDIAAT